MVKEISPTGRKPGEPNIQFLKPPVTPDVQQMVDDIKAAMAEVVGFPLYPHQRDAMEFLAKGGTIDFTPKRGKAFVENEFPENEK